MFDHITICDPKEFFPAETAPVLDVVQAKMNTLDFFTSMGVVDDEDLSQVTERDRYEARAAFAAVVDPNIDERKAKKAALALRTPTSTAYAATMLQAYDWDFAAQASHIRAFVVSKLIEEAENGKNAAKDRLRALELMGKVAEVDLFTEKIRVSVTQAPQAEIERRLMEKIKAFEVVDVEPRDVRTDDPPDGAS